MGVGSEQRAVIRLQVMQLVRTAGAALLVNGYGHDCRVTY